MDLSIIVVNWNTRDLLRRCLDSIYGTVSGLSFEVIVVDNGSADGSCKMVSDVFPQVIQIRNQRNRGFAAANNQALVASRGRHVLLLNSDAVLLEDTASRMIDFLDRHPGVAIAGGKLLNQDGTFQNSYADFPTLWSEFLLLTGLSRWFHSPTYPSYPEKDSQHRRSVDWVSGALMMVRAEAIQNVGILDEDYFMYVEEVDWCYRMKLAGWAVFYLPEAQAVHSSGASYARVPERKRAQLYHSKWLFVRKHRGSVRAASYRFLVRVFSAFKLAAWFLLGLSTAATRREWARQNVASYRTLLSNL